MRKAPLASRAPSRGSPGLALAVVATKAADNLVAIMRRKRARRIAENLRAVCDTVCSESKAALYRTEAMAIHTKTKITAKV